jgi:hypothetical protein
MLTSILNAIYRGLPLMKYSRRIRPIVSSKAGQRNRPTYRGSILDAVKISLPNDSRRGVKSPRVHIEEQQNDPTHPRGIFHQADRLESLRDHWRPEILMKTNRTRTNRTKTKRKRTSADEPPVVREPDED